jgi:hypothetical protein
VITPRSLLLLIPLLVAGCAAQDAAGVATVSAVAAGGALAPIGQAYQSVTGEVKESQAKLEAVNARFDPVSEGRIEAIMRRDPIADARLLRRSGIVALLPAIPGAAIYPGLWAPRHDVSLVEQNPDAARRSKLYLDLEELMNPESADFRQPAGEHRYHSPVFLRFADAAAAYKAAFNLEVYRLESEKKSSESPEPASELRPGAAHPNDRQK